jgi:hypothetical protein
MKITKIVLDNVLTEKQRQNIINSQIIIDNQSASLDAQYTWDEMHLFHPIISIIAQHFDLTDAITYEMWQQNNKRPKGWHYDRDEIAYQNGCELYPIATSVYYLNVSDLDGGNLYFEDDTFVIPKTNRLVIFSPGVEHYVDRYSGKRHSIIINPWDRIVGKLS